MQTEPAQRDAEHSSRLSHLWRAYAEKVYGPDYPLYRSLAAAIADDRETMDLLLECRGEAHDPNMLLACIQYLILEGDSHPLAELYGRAHTFATSPVPEAAGALVADFCHRRRTRLQSLLNSRHVQTNETGRCGGIALGLIEAARLVGDPVAVVDAGASAGLNLALDEYLLDFGSAGRIGPEESAVHLSCEVRQGRLPQPLQLPAITQRVGIDRMPIDVHDVDTVRWLLACIWPGTGRQDRARAAIAAVSSRPSLVRQGDMVKDLGPVLNELPPGPAVVITSWSYSYLPVDLRGAFAEALRAEGRRRPVAWVYCDLLGTDPKFDPAAPPPPNEPTPSVLGLALFDGDREQAEGLAYMHSHGAWIRWVKSE